MVNGKKEEDYRLHFLREQNTFGQKAADNLAKWAGSWTFIISFTTFFSLWILGNGYFWIKYNQGNPFDPYPFILLNLILSCIAAIQAPVILMSQRRESERDRAKAKYDYTINRKSEKKIEEIQRQIGKIEELIRKRKD
jgi:uncharacterized membrane protein